MIFIIIDNNATSERVDLCLKGRIAKLLVETEITNAVMLRHQRRSISSTDYIYRARWCPYELYAEYDEDEQMMSRQSAVSNDDGEAAAKKYYNYYQGSSLFTAHGLPY